jgi:hypothetical protein
MVVVLLIEEKRRRWGCLLVVVNPGTSVIVWVTVQRGEKRKGYVITPF